MSVASSSGKIQTLNLEIMRQGLYHCATASGPIMKNFVIKKYCYFYILNERIYVFFYLSARLGDLNL